MFPILNKFSVVNVDGQYHIIPSCWITENRKRVVWPDHITSTVSLQIAIVEELMPGINKQWPSYEIEKCFSSFDTYEEASEKLFHAKASCTSASILKDKMHKRKEFHTCSQRHQNRIIQNEVGQHVRRISSCLRSEILSRGDIGRDDIADISVQSFEDTKNRNNVNYDCQSDSDYELNLTRRIFGDDTDDEAASRNSHNERCADSDNSDTNADHDCTALHEENLADDGEQLLFDLSQWAIKYNIRHNAINELINILKRNIPNCTLPVDARTLLNTPRQCEIMKMDEGEYSHFGVDDALQSITRKYADADVNDIELSLNVDGLPISRSSTNSFWPILISDKKTTAVAMVGVYYGKKKPASANNYLKKFVEELRLILDQGYFCGNRKIGVTLSTIICDAPAKAFILSTKYHTGFYSCSKCTIAGTCINRTTCFPYEEFPSRLRTDEDFALQSDDEYHRGRTILADLPNVGLVTNVPLDYMHLICLGAVKKICLLLLKGPLSIRISGNTIDTISKKLISMSKIVSSDFARKPRRLSEISNWKATEFRQFLLYTGPIVLKNHVDTNIYVHFITLHVAVSILVSPELVKEEFDIKYDEDLLDNFVKNFEIIYGKQFISHNIYNLLNLCNDVRNFGPLDKFSSFPFVNFLSSLKTKMRKPEKPLQQLARRYGEQKGFVQMKNLLLTDKFVLQNQHFDGPLTVDLDNIDFLQYKVMKNKSCTIDSKDVRNNCILLKDNTVVIVLNIIQIKYDEIYFVGNKCKFSSELYNQPCSSKILDIYEVSRVRELSQWKLNSFKKKMCYFKLSESHCFVMPIRHDVTY